MKRRLYQITIIIVSLFIIQGFSRNLVELWQQKQRLGKAKDELARLEQQEADVQKKLAYYQSDEYVEKIAREKLLLGKADETVIVVPTTYQQDNQNEEPPKKSLIPWWKSWLKRFGF